MKFDLHQSVEAEHHDIRINGVQIVKKLDTTEVYTDPFRTVPVFLYQHEINGLIIFSKMESFLNEYNDELIVDVVGFWETLLYGNAIWTRTLFKNLYQLPAACVAVINNKTNEFTINRYWNYCIQEDKTIDTIEKAVDGLDYHFNRVFSQIDINKNYVMGMSGGMDSRITLAYLSKYLPKENLKLFTYGFDDKILEYKYAKEIAVNLGFDIPVFHKLLSKSYKNALDYLPQKSGGQIGINHCHMIDFFKSNGLESSINISTYFTDALLGWECDESQLDNPNPYLKVLEEVSFIPSSIKKEIKCDAQGLFKSFTLDSNISSIDEYKYISERNQKFHTYLAFIQTDYISSINPFLDFDLLQYCLSMPRQFRANKKIIDDVLELKFKEISSRDFKDISSRFQWGKSGKVDFYKFRLTNSINSVLRIFTRGYFQIFNKYQTEELERILYRNFYKDLEDALVVLEKKGLITRSFKNEMKKMPIRSVGFSERYCMISIAKILNHV